MKTALVIPTFIPAKKTMQEIRAASRAFDKSVLDCLEEHQPISNAGICEILGCEPRYLRQKMSRLIAEGEVYSQMIAHPTGKSPFLTLYSLGEGSNDKNGPKQRTVTSWKPQAVKHTELHAALYGQKQQS